MRCFVFGKVIGIRLTFEVRPRRAKFGCSMANKVLHRTIDISAGNVRVPLEIPILVEKSAYEQFVQENIVTCWRPEAGLGGYILHRMQERRFAFSRLWRID